MQNDQSLTQLTDDALIIEAKRLASHERVATATLVRALMELDARQLYLREGCPSLFAYCTQALHLAEGAAYNRIEAARLAARFPQVLEALSSGAVNLTTARLLAPHLTMANIDDLLASARYKTKREVEVLVAALSPKPAAPTVVRKLGTAQTGPGPVSTTAARTDAAGDETTMPNSASVARPAPVTVPLAPDRYKIQFTVTRATYDKLRQAQDLLRHAVPTGDPAEIFDRALTLLIQNVERRKFAAASKPRETAATAEPKGRHIPAAVRREVWARDGGRCAFVGREGRCRETAFLELHHVQPYADGGASTTKNIELRCRAHNTYEARLFFGADYVRERPNSFWNEFGRS